jgi:hypothetical protein
MPGLLDDPLLPPEVVAELTGLTENYLAKRRMAGDGAPYVKIGKTIRYRRSAVEAWLSQLERRSTTDVGPLVSGLPERAEQEERPEVYHAATGSEP